MDRNRKLAIAALVLAAINDLAAVPVISRSAPRAVVTGVVLCALCTIVAGIGLARFAPWARPVGIASRAIDLLATFPVLFAGLGGTPVAAATTSVIVSVAAVALVARLERNLAL